MKRLVTLVLLLTLVIAATASAETLKVGVTAGPHEEIMEVVRDLLAEQGIEVEIVTFIDYVTPNLALDAGETDANSFQHIPYLEQFAADRRLEITWIAPTVIFPMGLYSNKLSSLEKLPINAQVAIPNDPTNGGRALLLLESAGLIELKDGVGVAATVFDIAANPRKLRITEMDAANLPRSLQDVDLAAINTNYAIEAGINPVKDSLFIENSDSPWVNVIAVRTADQDNPIFQKLIDAYHSPEVYKFIEQRFAGSVVPGFTLD